ncbi:hypothetical protein A8E95_34990 [Burkholderia cenocepacia]|nr:hypothetical protein A8E96_13065 [Burkholderia cenocepacia]ONW24487.1 hypothetical protein A8E95_34990 [Burkholderia cenocepacia]
MYWRRGGARDGGARNARGAMHPRQARIVRHPSRYAGHCASRCARRRFHARRAGIGPGGETR